MGIVMPTVTESVMSVVPREHGGAGSAITNTSRQVAVALGVAVLGSILAQAYRDQFAPALTALPAAARSAATQSLAATQAAASQLTHGLKALLTTADQAFVHAMRVTTVVSITITITITITTAIAVCGAALIAFWIPGRGQAARASATGQASATGPASARAAAEDAAAQQAKPVLAEE